MVDPTSTRPILIPVDPVHGSHARGGDRALSSSIDDRVLDFDDFPNFKAVNWDRYTRGLSTPSASTVASVCEILERLTRARTTGAISRRDVFEIYSRDAKLGIVAAVIWGYPKGNLPGGKSFNPVFDNLSAIARKLNEVCGASMPAKGLCDIFDQFQGLGPSTFTKLLYFGSVVAAEGPCLVYDQMVMRSIAISSEGCWNSLRRELGSPRLGNGRFRTFPKKKQIETYGSYLRTARELAGRDGDPAAIELDLFLRAPKGKSAM